MPKVSRKLSKKKYVSHGITAEDSQNSPPRQSHFDLIPQTSATIKLLFRAIAILHRTIISLVNKNPFTTVGQIKNTLQEVDVRVSKSTIREDFTRVNTEGSPQDVSHW